MRVAQAYFDVLAAQDTLATTRASKAAIGEQLASAKRNFEVGTATITDTREAQARFDLATAQEIAAENDLRTKRIALDQLVGRSGVAPKGLAVPVVLPPIAAAGGRRVGAAAPTPSTRRCAGPRSAWTSRELETEKARAGNLPTVDARSAASARRATRGDRRHRHRRRATAPAPSTNASIGVQLNLPLFAGYSIQNRIKETLSLEEKSRNDLEAARRGVAQGTRQAFFGVQSRPGAGEGAGGGRVVEPARAGGHAARLQGRRARQPRRAERADAALHAPSATWPRRATTCCSAACGCARPRASSSPTTWPRSTSCWRAEPAAAQSAANGPAHLDPRGRSASRRSSSVSAGSPAKPASMACAAVQQLALRAISPDVRLARCDEIAFAACAAARRARASASRALRKTCQRAAQHGRCRRQRLAEGQTQAVPAGEHPRSAARQHRRGLVLLPQGPPLDHGRIVRQRGEHRLQAAAQRGGGVAGRTPLRLGLHAEVGHPRHEHRLADHAGMVLLDLAQVAGEILQQGLAAFVAGRSAASAAARPGPGSQPTCARRPLQVDRAAAQRQHDGGQRRRARGVERLRPAARARCRPAPRRVRRAPARGRRPPAASAGTGRHRPAAQPAPAAGACARTPASDSRCIGVHGGGGRGPPGRIAGAFEQQHRLRSGVAQFIAACARHHQGHRRLDGRRRHQRCHGAACRGRRAGCGTSTPAAGVASPGGGGDPRRPASRQQRRSALASGPRLPTPTGGGGAAAGRAAPCRPPPAPPPATTPRRPSRRPPGCHRATNAGPPRGRRA